MFSALFPERICLNLDRRPERWARMQSRIAAAGLGPIRRVAAIDGARVPIPAHWPETRGAYGCLQSHLAAVRAAQAAGHPQLLILEDDVLLDEDFHEKFRHGLRSLPADWDMLFFGCLHHDAPVPVGPGVARLRGSFSTFMYAIRQSAYAAFIRLNDRARKAVDTNNTILQRLLKCYCFLPHLAWVDESYSDAQEGHLSHWYIRDSLVLRSREVAAMERKTAMIVPCRAPWTREEDWRKLEHVLRHHSRHSAVLLLETGNRATLERRARPVHCAYHFLEASEAPTRGTLLAEGSRWFRGEKDYLILNEAGVLCSILEMRANLIKCAEHGAVSSFRSYIDLDEEDSERLVRGEGCDLEKYVPRPRRGRFSEYVTVHRRALSDFARWDEGEREPGSLIRIFDSPGCTVRLCLGSARDPSGQTRGLK